MPLNQFATLFSPTVITADVNPDPNDWNDTLNFFVPAHWMWSTSPYVEIEVISQGGNADTNPWNNWSSRIPIGGHGHDPLNLVFVPLTINGCTPSVHDFIESVDYDRIFY